MRARRRYVIGVGVFVLSVVPSFAHDWVFDRDPPAYPYSERDPADPRAGKPTVGYKSVTSGVRGYRPVDPLPWGDINKRVSQPEGGAAQTQQQPQPQQTPAQQQQPQKDAPGTPPAGAPMPGMQH